MYKRLANLLMIGATFVALLLLAADADASPGDDGVKPASLAGVTSLPAGAYAGTAKPWAQVNDAAFGLDDPSGQNPPYSSEDGFEVTVFNDQLYVGMEGDNQYGARVWRTKTGVTIARSQADWEQVVDDAFGDVNNNDHIDSLQPFGGYIYASTAQSHTADGTEVWRSSSGDLGSWVQANADGFGNFLNKNFKDMAELTVGGTPWLCGGTMNWATDAQTWCTTDGAAWEQKNVNGFGGYGYGKVWSTGVHGSYLYAGTECNNWGACPGAVWRTDGTADASNPGRWQWDKVLEATSNNRVDIIGSFDGYVYVGFDGGNGTEVWRSASGDAGMWAQVNSDGFGDTNNGRVIGDAGVVYNGALYVATLNQATGAQVWRTTDGTTWGQVSSGGFGDANTFAAQLVAYNGYLYAWATNYQTGQQVLRTKAPICEQQTINGPGPYNFDGVGVALNFKEENLDSVEVCVYPGAFPEEQVSEKLLKRHWEINATPAGGTFKVDVTLTYTDEEFAASGIGGGDTAYLVHNSGGQWTWCPSDKLTWDTANNAVTCADVTAFSTFAVAGSATPPKAATGVIIIRSGNDVQLTWNPVTQDVNGNPLSSVQYRVYRKTNDAYFTPTANELIATVSGTSYTDAGAVGDLNNNYFYVVTAVDDSGNESAASTRVGKFNISVLPGWNLLSWPVLPADMTLDGVLGNQLYGTDSPLTADRVLVWDGGSQAYASAWYCAGACTGWGEPWANHWLANDYSQSSLTLPPDAGFWVQNRSGATETLVVVGRVAGADRSVVVGTNWQLLGSAFPGARPLDSVNLPATGTDSPLTADRVLYWDASAQAYKSAWYCGGATCEGWGEPWASHWLANDYSQTDVVIQPGHAFWYQNRHQAYTWLNPVNLQ